MLRDFEAIRGRGGVSEELGDALLGQALRIDIGQASESRLANLVAQRRARWLLSRTERLFAN